jgi:flavin reductase (DIM6/NTAB) family NADH-FMN oxidoreductase RutF
MAKKRFGPTTDLFPMPALLVAVRTGVDSANIVTVAWAGVVGDEPPMLALDIAESHYSTPFIEREGNFSVNIPSAAQAVEADYCGIVSGSEDPEKAKTCGFTLLPATQISSPLLAECPLNFECRVAGHAQAGATRFILAEILETHIDETALDSRGKVKAEALDPLIFTPDGAYFRLGERVARAFSVGKKLRRGG